MRIGISLARRSSGVVSARRMSGTEKGSTDCQYSSASMIVMMRSVTDGSDGSGE